VGVGQAEGAEALDLPAEPEAHLQALAVTLDDACGI
jgi:hypothetical protein